MALTSDEVGKVLDIFVRDFAVDIPAVHINGDYLIPLGELEYALSIPSREWLEEITAAYNAEQ
jgi:hypothetical protein